MHAVQFRQCTQGQNVDVCFVHSTKTNTLTHRYTPYIYIYIVCTMRVPCHFRAQTSNDKNSCTTGTAKLNYSPLDSKVSSYWGCSIAMQLASRQLLNARHLKARSLIISCLPAAGCELAGRSLAVSQLYLKVRKPQLQRSDRWLAHQFLNPRSNSAPAVHSKLPPQRLSKDKALNNKRI